MVMEQQIVHCVLATRSNPLKAMRLIVTPCDGVSNEVNAEHTACGK